MALSITNPAGPSPKTSASPPPLSTSLSSSAVRSPSPQPPPASPLTPPAQPAKLATTTPPKPIQPPPPPPQFIEQPPSLPFSSHDSSDAIALRAAISSLQFQRLQAQRDLRTLEDIKRQAVERPEEYRRHVIATAHAKPSPPPWAVRDSPDQDIDDHDDAVLGASSMSEHDSAGSQSEATTKPYPVTYGSMLQPSAKITAQSATFPAVPLPQDVVRCPPIEWAKYNIVGESLDKLHRDQQVRPGDAASSQRDMVVAAPYNPFLDKLDPPEATPSSRKDSGSSASDQHAQRRSSKPAM
ncbi:hypothetical protein E4T49_03492 [Aureobasidium sp. EXF-10728]|nr:hypothetical protein E4T49_03492 [Aureobasidium sp. EXF-10728]